VKKQKSNKVSKRGPQKGSSRDYAVLVSNLVDLVERARVGAVRSVNTILTSTYWLIGRRIVEHEQSGAKRAEYREEFLKKLSRDLRRRLGRGFSDRNVEQMRLFYLNWPISQTVSAEFEAGSISQTVSAKFEAVPQFSLPWSYYVRLLSVSNPQARRFYLTRGDPRRLVGAPTRPANRYPGIPAHQENQSPGEPGRTTGCECPMYAIGDERLKDALRRATHVPLGAMASSILEELKIWMGGAAQYDDPTFIVMKVQ